MLSIVTTERSEEWDRIVRSFAGYDVYYLSGYVKAFEGIGDGEAKLFYYEDDKFKAINVVLLRDIEKDGHFTGKLFPGTFFDMITPYGYGGFLIQGDVTENDIGRLDAAYCEYCRNHGIISEFVRFHPLRGNSEGLRMLYDITPLGKTITIDLSSEEVIWSNLTSKNRNMIRKAQKSGVKIFWGRSETLLRKFIPLYNSTMDRNQAKKYYYFEDIFYDSILNDLKYNSLIFYAVYQDKIIAMSIILSANQQLNYHLSALDKAYHSLAPTNLLLYEAACWGSSNGFKTFHLGGGVGSKEDDLYQFKSSFNRNSDTLFRVGRKIFDQGRYEDLMKIRMGEEANTDSKDAFMERLNSGFFPGYRA